MHQQTTSARARISAHALTYGDRVRVDSGMDAFRVVFAVAVENLNAFMAKVVAVAMRAVNSIEGRSRQNLHWFSVS
jgi:hypothetical protein